MLRELGTDLWCYEESLRFRGLEIGRRMVVARVSSGGLLVHSPATLNASLEHQLRQLGPVEHVVPASRLHGHLHMAAYRRAFPDAKHFAAPGLAAHRRDLVFDGLLGSCAPPEWAGVFDQAAFLGNFFGDEIVFFHRPTRTLIVGDLCFNIALSAPWHVRLILHGRRCLPGLHSTPAFQKAVRNRPAARRSVEHILKWRFDRVVPGHGAIVDAKARAAFAQAFEWLQVSLPGGRSEPGSTAVASSAELAGVVTN